MALSTLQAPGNTAVTIPSFDVAAGGQIVVGMFSATDIEAPDSLSIQVYQVTPGAPIRIGALNRANPSMVLIGPATYSIKRPAYNGQPYGVFKHE